MRITNMALGNSIYTSNAYLVRGNWNTLADKNTLVDTGRDPVVLANLEQASTGVGKPRVEQVVLTHNHYDHIGIVQALRKRYRPMVYAFSPNLSGVDRVLRHGDWLLLGDSWFEVIHVPCHSQDSVCFYHPGEGVLFSGDISLQSHRGAANRSCDCGELADELLQRRIYKIYPGHGGEYIPAWQG